MIIVTFLELLSANLQRHAITNSLPFVFDHITQSERFMFIRDVLFLFTQRLLHAAIMNAAVVFQSRRFFLVNFCLKVRGLKHTCNWGPWSAV
jgi:hypothetical protein